MKKLFFLFFSFPALTSLFAQEPVDLVYPFLDAANSRWFYFSSACRPFGLVNLSPDTETDGTWGSGYRYNEENIKGFSHVHAWQLAGLLVMPVSEPYSPELMSDYSSDFSHSNEIAKPGYHQVLLDRYQINVELTSTTRVGYHRYSFDPTDSKGVVIDLVRTLGPSEMGEFKIEEVGKNALRGYLTNMPTRRRPKPTRVYFNIKFDTDYLSVKDREKGLAYVSFRGDIEQLQMKVGISYVSEEKALKNLRTELDFWDFDRVVEESSRHWNDELSKILIGSQDSISKRRFYTDLWHSLQGRRIVNDADGEYADNTGDSTLIKRIPTRDGRPTHNHYNSDSFWGAQWTLNTLWPLVYPNVSSGFVKSMLVYYRDGGLIPRGPAGGNYTYVMTGASSTPFVVTNFQKGIRDFDVEVAYEGLRKNHLPGGLMSKAGYEHDGEVGGMVEDYIQKGYIPYPQKPSPTAYHQKGTGMTLEYASQDYALAQMAKALDKREDHELFMSRSENYRNVYNPKSGYMHSRNVDGDWEEGFDPLNYAHGFVESNAAQSTWYVPHDIEGLATLMGGKEQLVRRLHHDFMISAEQGFTAGKSHSQETLKEARRIPINYGNQPSIHTAFIFSEAGYPELAQYWSRRVAQEVYQGLSPKTGYNGDEDQGLMGALAVLLKVGLFQVDMGVNEDPIYWIGSPLYDRIVISLDSDYYQGSDFEIEVINGSDETPYVSEVRLNGAIIDRMYVRHSELVKGGKLILKMAGRPKNPLVKSLLK